MRKIATPRDLQAALQHLLEYSQGANPSRKVLAAQLRVLAEEVSAQPEVMGANEALKWGTFGSALNVAGKELHGLAKEADEARKQDGEHKEDIQKIFEAVTKGQHEVDHAMMLANTLATKVRKAK